MRYILFRILKNLFRFLKVPQITKLKIFGFELVRTKNFLKFQKIIDSDLNEFQNKIIKVCYEYSMMNSKRLWNLFHCSESVLDKNIEGDFVECGVFKGGGIILMSSIVEYHKKQKRVWAFDTFEGMSKPDENDKDYSGEDAMIHWKVFNNKGFNSWCYASLNDVKSNVSKASKKLNLQMNNIKYIKGDVEKTLKDNVNLPKKISILRLDTDFYNSTKLELEILYPKLSVGGFLIVDDYGYWKGSKKACLEYFGNDIQFIKVDDSCVYLKKIK